jgi:glycosyltransferase involved in cell wall biosynthesis
MNLLFPDLASVMGGSQVSGFEIMAHLQRAKSDEIKLYCAAPTEGPVYAEAKQRNIPVLGHGVQPFPGMLHLLWVITYMWQAVRLLRAHKIDIVHCTNHTILLWLVPCKLVGVPLIWNVRALPDDNWKGRLRQWIYMRGVRHILYVSQAARKAVHLGTVPTGTHEAVIPNFVSENLLTKSPSDGVKRGSIQIGWVGRLDDPIKDVRRATRIFQDLPPTAELTFFGPVSDEHKQSLLESIPISCRNRVHFAGKQNPDNIFPQIDLLLLTSVMEGSPRVIMEAAMHGVPAVAHAVGGVPELIQNGKTGYIFTKDQQAVEALTKMVGDQDHNKALGHAAHTWFRTNRSWENVIQMYTEFYRNS